jgi:hypothetical protein
VHSPDLWAVLVSPCVIADEQEASTFENTKEELASFKDQC